MILLLVLVLAGCENSKLTEINPEIFPESAEAAVEDFRLALSGLDSQALQNLLSEDFRLHAGDNSHILGIEFLDRDRFVLALTRMANPPEELEDCTIDTVLISFWSNDEWVPESGDSRFPNTHSKQYSVSMVYGYQNYALFGTYGTLTFFAKSSPLESPDTGVKYEIAGISDESWDHGKSVASDSFSEVISTYLYEGLPHARLPEDPIQGVELMTFTLDASSSWCPGEGLHDQPYRWNVDGAEQWSEWTSIYRGGFQFGEPGDHSVILEVRNQAGWTAQAKADFEVYASHPATMEQLFATFSYAHENMDYMAMLNCLAPDFRFILQAQDVIDFGFPGNQLDVTEYVVATSSLFAEASGIDDPHTVQKLYFSLNSQTPEPNGTAWIDIHANRMEANPLFVRGNVSFVARMLTEDLPGIGPRGVWRFEEITDQTNTIEEVTWSGLLGTYRR